MNAHLQLTFAAWLTSIAAIGTLVFVAWLLKCALASLLRDWRRNQWRVDEGPRPDARIYSVGRDVKGRLL
jgi:hypothetical protein